MRLIDVDNAIHDCKALANDKWNKKVSPVSWADAYQDFVDYLEETPTVEAQPVAHGHWIFGEANHREYMKCSVCLTSQTPTGVFTYCPNCGAKMDGGDENVKE